MSNNEWVAKDSQIQAKIDALVKANPSLNFNGNFRAWDIDVLTEEANIYCLQRVNEYLKQHPNEISYAIDSAGHYVGNYNYNSLDGLKAINDLLATIISNEKNRFTQDQKKQLDSLLLKQSNLIIQYANESLKKILETNISQINPQDINSARQMLKTVSELSKSNPTPEIIQQIKAAEDKIAKLDSLLLSQKLSSVNAASNSLIAQLQPAGGSKPILQQNAQARAQNESSMTISRSETRPTPKYGETPVTTKDIFSFSNMRFNDFCNHVKQFARQPLNSITSNNEDHVTLGPYQLTATGPAKSNVSCLVEKGIDLEPVILAGIKQKRQMYIGNNLSINDIQQIVKLMLKHNLKVDQQNFRPDAIKVLQNNGFNSIDDFVKKMQPTKEVAPSIDAQRNNPQKKR